MTELKQFVLDFTGFVNENLEQEAFEPETFSEPTGEVPPEVIKIAAGIVNGNYEGHKIIGTEGDTIKLRATDQDFKYRPDTLTLRDFGFETWSAKPFDVTLTLLDADPVTKEISYVIEYEPKNARRAKVEIGDEDEDFVDSYEQQPDEFEDVPEPTGRAGQRQLDMADAALMGEPSDIDDDDEDLFEARKKKMPGGFPNIKVKEVKPPAQKKAETKPKAGFKPDVKQDLLTKKNTTKLAEPAKAEVNPKKK